jgi:DNA-binding transcriptional LysR family regulator
MNTTLDAWEVFQNVVLLGGFAPAAKKLNRSQSTISYVIGRLQEQLGVQLFEIQGRKSQLTEAGRALLADVEPYLAGFHQLEKRASLMASSGTSEIQLSVDSIFPNDRLYAALAEFSQRYPHLNLKLWQDTFLSADVEFSLRGTQLCISGLISSEMFVKPILVVEMIAVAHKDHPLHSIKHRLTRADIMRYMLVTISGAASGTLKHQPQLAAQRVFAVRTIESAISAVRHGLCFGWLPKYSIKSDIENGTLVPLPLYVGKTREVGLNLVCKDFTSSSREVNALAKLLGVEHDAERV